MMMMFRVTQMTLLDEEEDGNDGRPVVDGNNNDDGRNAHESTIGMIRFLRE